MLYEELDIIEVVESARKGCEMAFAELYRRFWRKLKVMCLIDNIPEEDHGVLMQDVYIKVFRDIDMILPENFDFYISTTMKNRLRNYRDRR